MRDISVIPWLLLVFGRLAPVDATPSPTTSIPNLSPETFALSMSPLTDSPSTSPTISPSIVIPTTVKPTTLEQATLFLHTLPPVQQYHFHTYQRPPPPQSESPATYSPTTSDNLAHNYHLSPHTQTNGHITISVSAYECAYSQPNYYTLKLHPILSLSLSLSVHASNPTTSFSVSPSTIAPKLSPSISPITSSPTALSCSLIPPSAYTEICRSFGHSCALLANVHELPSVKGRCDMYCSSFTGINLQCKQAFTSSDDSCDGALTAIPCNQESTGPAVCTCYDTTMSHPSTQSPATSHPSTTSPSITLGPSNSPTSSPSTVSPSFSPITQTPTSRNPTDSPTTSDLTVSPTTSDPTVSPTTSSETSASTTTPSFSPTTLAPTASPTVPRNTTAELEIVIGVVVLGFVVSEFSPSTF